MPGLIETSRLPVKIAATGRPGLLSSKWPTSIWIEEYRRALAATARAERLAADVKRAMLLKSDYR